MSKTKLSWICLESGKDTNQAVGQRVAVPLSWRALGARALPAGRGLPQGWAALSPGRPRRSYLPSAPRPSSPFAALRSSDGHQGWAGGSGRFSPQSCGWEGGGCSPGAARKSKALGAKRGWWWCSHAWHAQRPHSAQDRASEL